MTESLLTAFMFNNELIEVGYAEWSCAIHKEYEIIDGKEKLVHEKLVWSPVEPIKIDLPKRKTINRVILELPDGCFEVPIGGEFADQFVLTKGGPGSYQTIYRCHRAFEEGEIKVDR